MGKYLFMFLILAGLLFGVGMFFHELAHVGIYNSYGIDSEVKLAFPSVMTVPYEECPTDGCVTANNINDAIAYGLSVIHILIMAFALFLFCIIEDNHKELKEKIVEVNNPQ